MMNLFTLWLLAQSRRFFTAFLLSAALFIGTALQPGASLEAAAESLMPEATYQIAERQSRSESTYPDQTTRSELSSDQSQRRNQAPAIDLDNGQTKQVQQNLKDTADNIREKLNLDQPLYPGTKEFINDVQEKVSGAVETK